MLKWKKEPERKGKLKKKYIYYYIICMEILIKTSRVEDQRMCVNVSSPFPVLLCYYNNI